MHGLKEHMQPHGLERLSFLWSEVRLLIAALALLLGGIPPLRLLLPAPSLHGFVGLILTLSWLISGLAAAYLLYRWYTGGRMLFGGRDMKDTVAFFVMVISGINLGIVPILGNIGMSISSNYTVFIVASVAYIVAALYLYRRWKQFGEKIF